MFEIRKAFGARSCANCNAATYEDKYHKKAEIKEIKIGCMVNALCHECMLKLANQILAEVTEI